MRFTLEERKIYYLYRATPDQGRSSYLWNHYDRGRQGIMKPEQSSGLAFAAWKAGYDSGTARP